MPRIPLLLAVALSFAPSACGSTSGDAASTDARVDTAARDTAPVAETAVDTSSEVADAPHDEATARTLAAAICDPFADCCTKAGLVEDHAACETAVAGFLQRYVDHAEAVGAVPDLAALPACRDAIKLATPTCADLSEDSGMLLVLNTAWQSACFRLVGGALPAGAACLSSLDCAQPANGYGLCSIKASATEGHCESVTFVEAGAPCSSSGPTHAECAPRPNLQCIGTCVEGHKLGEPCFGRLTCTNDLWCDGTNHCLARLPPGAACDGLHDSCQTPGRCEPTTKTCVALAPLAAACSGDEACASRVCRGGTCAPTDAALLPGAAASCR